MATAVLWLFLLSALCHSVPIVTHIDYEVAQIYLQRGTTFDAELAEERAKGTIPVQGTGLLNGQLFAFRPDCAAASVDSSGAPMPLFGVDEDPLSYFYQKRGFLLVTINQTQNTYIGRRVCYTPDVAGSTYVDSNVSVTIFEIFSVAGKTSVQDQRYRRLIDPIRAYKYSTVTYVVEGIGLDDRLLLSLQYRCKDNGMVPPIEAETPARLFGTDATRTRAYVQFGRTQTDVPFYSKDLCVSRGNSGVFDFSGFVGNTMTVFPDCIEAACAEGACHPPTGNCLCWDTILVDWRICDGDKRNITAYVNQSVVPSDPRMCRDIKWNHFVPDRAVDQMYLINPTQRDRFPVLCSMVDGGWATIPNTYAVTQHFVGAQLPVWLPQNVSYDMTEQRVADIRNRSLYGKQDAIVSCQAAYADFSCRRAPYHVIHEAVWLQWDSKRLWPVYDFDGCCFWCCQQSTRPRTTIARFWSLWLPIRNVKTWFGAADDNAEDYRVDMQPVMFY